MQAKAERRQHFINKFAAPAVNVKEEDDRYELHLFAAGFTKDAFEISLTDNILTISGKTKEEEDNNTNSWRRQEFTARDFERKFELNDKVNTDEIAAEYNNGVLVVSAPKDMQRIEQNIRRIPIVQETVEAKDNTAKSTPSDEDGATDEAGGREELKSISHELESIPEEEENSETK